RLRVPAYAVWDTVIFILNGLGFVFIGLQIGPIWGRLAPSLRLEYGLVAGAVLMTVILARFLWVYVYLGILKLWTAATSSPPTPDKKAAQPSSGPSLRSALVVSWCGMRGIVTLAAAFALPGDFPQRDLILFCAFFVVLGTLLLQGLTLRPLLLRVRLEDGDPV